MRFQLAIGVIAPKHISQEPASVRCSTGLRSRPRYHICVASIHQSIALVKQPALVSFITRTGGWFALPKLQKVTQSDWSRISLSWPIFPSVARLVSTGYLIYIQFADPIRIANIIGIIEEFGTEPLEEISASAINS